MNENEQVVLEGMTSISALLGADCNNDRKIKSVWIDQAKEKSKSAEINFLLKKSQLLGFSVERVSSNQLDEVTTGKTHGGIIAFCTGRTVPELSVTDIQPNGFYVYLDGVEDPFNFGYTIRSLYACGANGLILPERNWMSAAGTVARSSGGTGERISMYTCSAEKLCDVFHEAHYQILCAEIRDSVSIFEKNFSYPILLVIGGEKRGISRTILQKSDANVRIDYGREFRGSLSTSSAAAVLGFELFRQNK